LIVKRSFKKKQDQNVLVDLDLSTLDHNAARIAIDFWKNMVVHTEDERTEVLKQMKICRRYRNDWLKKTAPSLTEKFPRYIAW
jgi:hypothetical protein